MQVTQRNRRVLALKLSAFNYSDKNVNFSVQKNWQKKKKRNKWYFDKVQLDLDVERYFFLRQRRKT